MSMKRTVRAILATAATIALGAAPVANVANAANVTPAQVAGNTPVGTVKPWDAPSSPPTYVRTGGPQEWVQQVDHKNVLSYLVHSPSMNRDIPIAVVPATDGNGNRVSNAPTIYLLNGAGGAEQNQDWLKMAPVRDFFAGKGVNVVIPQAGAFSYYTDWLDDSLNTPYLKGPQKWETFLTKELPGAIEGRIKADNHRAIAGMSMSATSSLLLAEHNQGFYDAVGSYAGCAATAYPVEHKAVELTVNRGGATTEQMWGPFGSPTNRYNDAMMNHEKLRGTELYISSGSGLAGKEDTFSYNVAKGYNPATAALGSAQLQVEGGAIEAGVNYCTHNFKAKLDQAGIPATYNFRNTGTHSWPHWIADLKDSWPVFERAFNK